MSRMDKLKDTLFLAMRIVVFCLFFVAPIAAFTSIAANTGGEATAAGLVLFMRLSK